jgi:hypothetical protein
MPAVMIGTNRQCRIELGQSGCVRNAPVPLEGLGREADQGWGEGYVRHEPLPPTLVRFAAQAPKGRGSIE